MTKHKLAAAAIFLAVCYLGPARAVVRADCVSDFNGDGPTADAAMEACGNKESNCETWCNTDCGDELDPQVSEGIGGCDDWYYVEEIHHYYSDGFCYCENA